MRILVAGREGQLARSLAAAPLPDGWRVECLGRPELDIGEPATIRSAVAARAPDLLVNAAAYTAVDKAESEPEAAFRVNRDGARNLAEAAQAAGVPIIHVSTDYVFPGNGSRPYRETDPVGPLGVYGQSKLAGESAVAEANRRHVILRTAWVHSPWGGNFVKTMLRLGRERDELGVVGDQTGTPSYAPDLAGGILSIASQIAGAATEAGPWGVYHLTNAGVTTWYDFAAQIFETAAQAGQRAPRLNRITTDQYPTPARRPHYSVLDNAKVGAAFGVQLRDWREATVACVTSLLAGSGGDKAAAG